MLAIIAGVLLVLWLLGFTAFHVTSGLIHILLVLAVISILFHFFRGRAAVSFCDNQTGKWALLKRAAFFRPQADSDALPGLQTKCFSLKIIYPAGGESRALLFVVPATILVGGSRDLAPRGRFELPTFRLTAERSTIELPGNCATHLFSF